MAAANGRDRWHERFRAQVLGAGDVLEGDGYLYRPGQLLISADDHATVAGRLDAHGLEPHHEHTARLDRHGVGVRCWRLPGEQGHRVAEVVDDLQALVPTRRIGVSPNHVFVGAPGYAPGGAGVPEKAPPGAEPTAAAEGEPVVGVLDTGLPRRIAEWHAALAAAAVGEQAAVDALDGDGDGLLDLEAGHGTFVAGVLRGCAPWLRFSVDRVLAPSGIGDEVEIARALLECTTPVVNLSLGTYTWDDHPPVLLAAVLDTLGADRLVVAAAGNEGQDRPYWPAAFPAVVAVGALDDEDGAPVRACFSNYGDWVDACAPAVDLLAPYVVGDYPVGDEVTRFAGWARWSGTSFAVPQVAAAVATRMRSHGLGARAAWRSLLDDAGRDRVDGLGAVFAGAPVPAARAR